MREVKEAVRALKNEKGGSLDEVAGEMIQNGANWVTNRSWSLCDRAFESRAA